MTTVRQDYVETLDRQRRIMDRERRAFAEAVVNAIKGSTRGEAAPFDVAAYSQARLALGPIFDEFYGHMPGDRSARYVRAIVRSVQEARAMVGNRPENKGRLTDV